MQNKCGKIGIIVLIAFVLFAMSFLYISGFDFLKSGGKPWQLLSFPTASPQSVYKDLTIVGRQSLFEQYKSLADTSVLILIDAWGVPLDGSDLYKDFAFFDDKIMTKVLHERLANRTKHAEMVELKHNPSRSIYLFGGDSTEYNRKGYVPSLGFSEVCFCQNCADDLMFKKLDSILNEQVYEMVALTTQSSRMGSVDNLRKTLQTIANVYNMHKSVKFIVQGTHRPTLGSVKVREKYYSNLVPAIILNPQR